MEKLTLTDVLLARERVKDVCLKTKLIPSPFFSKACGNEVYLKPENLQITGAFKIRGALNKISKLQAKGKQRGVIAASAGNHAQGVAYAAEAFGIAATIVMPESTPSIKVEATKRYGANVILRGSCYDEAAREAEILAEARELTIIHPFADLDVMAGQGTIGLEIIEELGEVDVVLVPIGGGGLISGICATLKALKNKVKIIGVEPAGANAMELSLAQGKLVSLNKLDTLADGAAVKAPDEFAFEMIKKYVDEIITIKDSQLIETIFSLAERHKLIAEATGALTLAGLDQLKFRDKKIVAIISGGNIDAFLMAIILNKGLVLNGLKKSPHLYGY